MAGTLDLGTIMPKFDDDTDRKVSIILSKGTLDWATASMVIANAAVSEGIELHLGLKGEAARSG